MPEHILWSALGWGVAALFGVIAWLAQRDRARLDTDVADLKNACPNIYTRINRVSDDLAAFRAEVPTVYVSRATLDVHVVEALKRIETKLDTHIAMGHPPR